MGCDRIARVDSTIKEDRKYISELRARSTSKIETAQPDLYIHGLDLVQIVGFPSWTYHRRRSAIVFTVQRFSGWLQTEIPIVQKCSHS